MELKLKKDKKVAFIRMCHILEFHPFQLYLKLLLESIPGSNFYCCPSQVKHDSLIYASLVIKWFSVHGETRFGVTKESAMKNNLHCFTHETVL